MEHISEAEYLTAIQDFSFRFCQSLQARPAFYVLRSIIAFQLAPGVVLEQNELSTIQRGMVQQPEVQADIPRANTVLSA